MKPTSDGPRPEARASGDSAAVEADETVRVGTPLQAAAGDTPSAREGDLLVDEGGPLQS